MGLAQDGPESTFLWLLTPQTHSIPSPLGPWTETRSKAKPRTGHAVPNLQCVDQKRSSVAAAPPAPPTTSSPCPVRCPTAPCIMRVSR